MFIKIVEDVKRSFRYRRLCRRRGDTLCKETNVTIYACFSVLEVLLYQEKDKIGQAEQTCLLVLEQLEKIISEKKKKWKAVGVEKAWKSLPRHRLFLLSKDFEKLTKEAKDMPLVQEKLCFMRELIPFVNRPKSYWHRVGFN